MDQALINLDNFLQEWRLIWVYGVSALTIITLLFLMMRLRGYKRQIAYYQGQIQESEQTRIQANQVLKEVKSANEQLAQQEQQISALQSSLNEKEQELAASEESAKQFQSEMTKRQNEFAGLQSQLQQREKLFEQLQEEKQQLQQQVETQKDLQNRFDELQEQLKQKTEQSGNLQDGAINEALAGSHLSEESEVREQLSRLESENQALKEEIQRDEKLESYFQKHNEQLTALNQELRAVLIQEETTMDGDAVSLAHKATALLKRLLSILKVVDAGRGEVQQASEAVVDISEQAEALWLKHYEYIDQLLECATGLVLASETAENNRNSSSLAGLRGTIEEQANYIARLKYDLEVKKLIIQERELSEENIPASIIKCQQEYQARIEELENKLTNLAHSRARPIVRERGPESSSNGAFEQVLYKVKSLLS